MNKNWTPQSLDRTVNRRLFWQMTLPMIAAGILLLTAGGYGAWRVHRLHKRGSDILVENVASIRAAEELETEVREVQHRLKRYLSTANGRHLEHLAERLPAAGKLLDEVRDLAKSNREQQLAERVEQGYARLADTLVQLTDQEAFEQRAQLAVVLSDEVIPNEILLYTARYIQFNEEQLADSRKRNQASANRLMFGLVLLGTCGGVVGLFAGYGIARRLSRAIVQLSLPVHSAAGKLNQVVGPIAVAADPGLKNLESILRAVSDRVAMVVERLQTSEREMLRAEQLAAVGQLAAGLAHELRNPLTSIKTIVQLADQPGEMTQRDVEVLQEEIERLERLVQSFLDFARPPQLQLRDVDLGELLTQTVDLVARKAQQQGIDVRYRKPQQPILVAADANLIRQMVLNLILNSFDATPREGHVELNVDFDADGRQAGETDRVARIRVRDTGCGLPDELGARIFEPFVSTKETGTGLGLSICRRIVEAHDGQISARRRELGTEFVVRLPRGRPTAAERTAMASP